LTGNEVRPELLGQINLLLDENRRRGHRDGALDGAAGRRASNADLADEVDADLQQRLDRRKNDMCAMCASSLTVGGTVFLPACLHSACRQCFVVCRANGEPLRCVLCNQLDGSMGNAPQPHRLIEAVLSRRDQRRCDECSGDVADSDATASHRCTECSHMLCDFHTAGHRRLQATREHAVTTVSVPSECAQHQRPLEAYCGTCKVSICLACTIVDHPAPVHQHHLLDADFCRQARARVRGAIVDAEKAAQARAARALDVAITATEISARGAALQREINANIDALHALLDARRAELLQAVDAADSADRERLLVMGQAERAAHTVLMSTVELATELTDDRTSAATLAQLEPAMCSRLQTLVAAVPGRSAPRLSQVTFSLDEDVERIIRCAGKISIQPASPTA